MANSFLFSPTSDIHLFREFPGGIPVTALNNFFIGELRDSNSKDKIDFKWLSGDDFIRIKYWFLNDSPNGGYNLNNGTFATKYTSGILNNSTNINGLVVITPDVNNGVLNNLKIEVAPGNKIGDVFLQIINVDGRFGTEDLHSSLYVRIRVHNKLANYWYGNSSITTYVGDNSYRPSVFAKFDDGPNPPFEEVGDISSHPYLSYNKDNNFISLSQDNTGRITGLSKGITNLSINFYGNSISPLGLSSIPVTINDPLTTFKSSTVFNISERSTSIPKEIKQNILFLGEGFKNRKEFVDWINLIIDEIKKDKYSPFKFALDAINIWGAFIPSNDLESGVTLALPIAKKDSTIDFSGSISKETTTAPFLPAIREGAPNNQNKGGVRKLIEILGISNNYYKFLEYGNLKKAVHGIGTNETTEELFDAWKYQTPFSYTKVMDTVFGFCIGVRNGDRKSIKRKEDLNNPNPMRWYLPYLDVDTKLPLFDPRRIDPAFPREEEFLNKFLQTIDIPPSYTELLKQDGSQATNANQIWGESDKRGFVFVLVNHFIHGAYERHYPNGERALCATAVGRRFNIDVRLNLTPNVKNLFNIKQIVEVKNEDLSPSTNRIKSLSSTIQHELGHALGLGDEYDYNIGGEGDFFLGIGNDTTSIEVNANLTAFNSIKSSSYIPSPTGNDDEISRLIDPTKIKWNWPRIRESSMVIGNIVLDQGFLLVPIEKTHFALKWSKWVDLNVEVFLREPDINNAEQNIEQLSKLYVKGLFTNSLNQECVKLATNLTDPNILTKFNLGSLLYIPLRDENNNILRLIHPTVMKEMEVHDLPLTGSKINCSFGNNEPQKPSLIFETEFRKSGIRLSDKVLGIYEGGGNYSCGVFRPSGISKMRGGSELNYADGSGGSNTPKTDSHLDQIPNNLVGNKRIYLKDSTVFDYDFVAQYYILNRIYPTNLSRLDAENYYLSQGIDKKFAIKTKY